MGRKWAVTFGERERMELERLVTDCDEEGAMEFLRGVVYPQVQESERTRGCLTDVEKPVDGLGRPVSRHKRLGDF